MASSALPLVISGGHAAPPLSPRAPRRSMSGWAIVRRGNALRASRRYVVLRAGSIAVYDGPDARAPALVMPLCGSVVVTNPAKNECVAKSPDGLRVSFTWYTQADMFACRSAFEFANRVLEDRFKTVSHRLLARRNDSEVIFGFDKATGEHAAIKVVSKDKSGHKTVAEAEVAIRMSIDHPAIVKTVDVFETPFDLFIVMNYMDGGSLARRLANKAFPAITEHEARVVMARLFSALSYLHARGIVHRNVKPENILIEQVLESRWPETARLSDFRMACFLDPYAAPSAEAAEFANLVVGTPDFLAPEAAVMTTQPDGTRKPCIGPETDMWAAGVTLYNMLSGGHLPFPGATTPEVLRNARHSTVKFEDPAVFGHVSIAAKSMIRSLLNPDRRKRPSSESAMHHPWFVGVHGHGEFLAPGSRPQLRGLEKFRAIVLCLRFLYRIGAAKTGFPKFISSKNMRFVNGIAKVDITPASIIFSKGVDIAPSGSEHDFTDDIVSPFEFTTSTLSPTPTERFFRTSQTSSVASFRSSQSSSHVDVHRQHANSGTNVHLRDFSRTMRRELDESGITTNMAQPGFQSHPPREHPKRPESPQSTLSHMRAADQAPQDESMASVSSDAESRRSMPPPRRGNRQISHNTVMEDSSQDMLNAHAMLHCNPDLEPMPLVPSNMAAYEGFVADASPAVHHLFRPGEGSHYVDIDLSHQRPGVVHGSDTDRRAAASSNLDGSGARYGGLSKFKSKSPNPPPPRQTPVRPSPKGRTRKMLRDTLGQFPGLNSHD